MNSKEIFSNQSYSYNIKNKEREFWTSKFDKEIIKSTFPIDTFTNLHKKRFEKIDFSLDNKIVKRLFEICGNSDNSLFTILLCELNILLYKYNQIEDVTIGTTIHKQDKETDFFNTVLPLSNKINEKIAFKEFLYIVSTNYSESLENQNYPVEFIIKHLNLEIQDNSFPLFDITLLLSNIHDKEYLNNIDNNINLIFTKHDDNILGTIEYNANLYKRESISQYLNHFFTIIENSIFNVDAKIEDIEYITNEEKLLLLKSFNSSALDIPQKSIIQIFKEQVDKNPHKLAVNYEDKSITYRELDAKSDELANYLKDCGIVKNALVGLFLERNEQYIICIWALIKLGAIYVPINKTLPVKRISYILNESNCCCLLTDDNNGGQFKNKNRKVIFINDVSFNNNKIDLTQDFMENQLVYLIYTSGSTGFPKGILIEQNSVISLISALNNLIFEKYGDSLNMCLLSPFDFDASVQLIFSSLLLGHSLFIVPEKDRSDGDEILTFLNKNCINISDGTPVHLRLLCDSNYKKTLNSLYHFLIAGDVLPKELISSFISLFGSKKTSITNLYGPTETCVDSTYFHINYDKIDELENIPIGKPLPNEQVYILNEKNQIQPVNVYGELTIGGDGLAKGYLNNVELTHSKFIKNPFDLSNNLYKTSDRARLLANGNIEFAGRLDNQIKIRGFRIELGEIEKQIIKLEGVKEVILTIKEDINNDKAIIANIIPDSVNAYTTIKLLEFEKQGLMKDKLWTTLADGSPFFYVNLLDCQNIFTKTFIRKSFLQNIQLVDNACIIDIGSNIGIFSLFISQICSDANIFAFEPNLEIFNILKLNVQLNDINAKIFNIALSNIEKETNLNYDNHSVDVSSSKSPDQYDIESATKNLNKENKHSEVDKTYDIEEIGSVNYQELYAKKMKCSFKTLSQVFRENGIQHVNLLKIDKESEAVKILEGIEENDWGKIDQFIIEVHNLETIERVKLTLQQKGYRVYFEKDLINRDFDLYYVTAIKMNFRIDSDLRSENKHIKTRFNPKWSTPENFKNTLKTYLKEKLPYYMLPSSYNILDSFPITKNGKIDIKALEDLKQSNTNRPVLPRNVLDKRIIKVWADVLKLKEDMLTIESDFFEVGGHSLRATILVSRINKEFGIKVHLTDLYRYSTIQELSDFMADTEQITYRNIKSVEKRSFYPLTSAQQRMFVLYQMDKKSLAYNIPQIIKLNTKLNKNKIENTFKKIIARHEIFQTAFQIINEVPVQVIKKDFEFHIESYKIQKENLGHLQNNFVSAFDLSKAPLLRISYVEVDDSQELLLMDMHHIITDGFSQKILEKEFLEIYDGKEMLPLKLQYKDFSKWQSSNFYRKEIKEQEKYWLNRYSNGVPTIDLPIDSPRPLKQSFEGAAINFILNEKETQEIRLLAKENDATLYMVILSLYYIILSKLSNQEDIVIGCPVAGRNHVDTQEMIGLFVNTLSIRGFVDGEKEFVQFLREIRRETINAFENQDYPFEDLVNNLNIDRVVNRNPLFDVLFNMVNIDEPFAGSARSESGKHYKSISKFDLTLTLKEFEKEIALNLEYFNCFNAKKIDNIILYFRRIVYAVIQNPKIRICDIEILAEQEKKQILIDFNKTDKEYPQEKLIHELFIVQAKTNPDRIAIVYEDRQLTYGELNKKSNQLAKTLRLKGIKANTVVGINTERSLEMIIGILAILKSGGTYLPIDLSFPEEKIHYILEESLCRFVIAGKKSDNKLSLVDSVIEMHELHEDGSDLENVNILHDNIYIIHTSGSTGNSKGVVVKHDGFLNLLHWYIKEFQFTIDSRTLLIAPISFDLAQKNIFASLISGGSLIIANKDLEYNHESDNIEKNQISIINCAPSAFYPFLDFNESNKFKKIRSLNYVILGGETIQTEKIKPFFKSVQCNLANTYGPTECTDIATVFKCSDLLINNNIIPIGKPISNVNVFILDKNGKPVPIGVPGNLYISGKSLSLGYQNNPVLTNQKFIELSINKKTAYSTGDIVKWLDDGNIEFIHRIDDQVKIRGYRVELGEIEYHLQKFKGVNDVVVLLKNSNNGERILCAYYTSEFEIEPSAIRSYLLLHLPNYMVPTFFVHLDNLPLTPNGKINKKILPEPKSNKGIIIKESNEVEKKLIALWSKVLNIEESMIGVNSDFFELGGNSLNAIRIVSNIQENFNVDIKLESFFTASTIELISNIIIEKIPSEQNLLEEITL